MLRQKDSESILRRRSRRYSHDYEKNSGCLGCQNCFDKAFCGGINVARSIISCIDYCCGNHRTCKEACWKNPHYADRIREIGGFSLLDIPRTVHLNSANLPSFIPQVYHGSTREKEFDAEAVAISLYETFDRRTGKFKYRDRSDFCARFGIKESSKIVIVGVAKDPPLERFWGFESGRREIMRALFGIADVVTAPNFSVFSNRPRTADLHSIKRIGIVHQEFLGEGIPCALHVNGRTDQDFLRWTEYLTARPEIDLVAYELATPTRKQWHTRQLIALARNVGRPLKLIVKGGSDVLRPLLQNFAEVSMIDGTTFVKTINRQRAVPVGNQRIQWIASPTLAGQSVHELLQHNWEAVELHYRSNCANEV